MQLGETEVSVVPVARAPRREIHEGWGACRRPGEENIHPGPLCAGGPGVPEAIRTKAHGLPKEVTMSSFVRIASIAALLGVIGAAPAAAAPAPAVPPHALDRMDRDLVACWNLGEPTPGNQVLNRAGGPLHGVRYGAEWEDDALKFDGTDDYVGLRPHRKLASLATGSISVWFNAHSAKWGECIQPIFYFGSGKGGSDASALIIELGHFWPDRKTTALYFTIMGDPGQKPTFCYDSRVDLELNTWHHFVAVMGEDFNTGYLDGVELTDRNYNFGGPTDNEFFADVVGPAHCTIGKGWFWIYPEPCYFDGAIGEVRVYSRPLDTGDVQRLYENTGHGSARHAGAHGAPALQAAAGGRGAELLGNQPNPFNPSTRIRFSVTERTFATLRVYSAEGKLVATLLRGTVDPGVREVRWDGRDDRGLVTGSGVYFCRLEAQDRVVTRKLILGK